MDLEIGFFGGETAGELSHKVPPRPLKTFELGMAGCFEVGLGRGVEIPRLRLGMTWVCRGGITSERGMTGVVIEWDDVSKGEGGSGVQGEGGSGVAGGVTGVRGCGIVGAVFRFSDGGVQS